MFFLRKLQNERTLQRIYIGHGHPITRYRQSIAYSEAQVIQQHERILASIAVQLPETIHRHMYGLLVATSERLLFITSSRHYGSFFDIYPYDTIEQLRTRRLKQTEIVLRFRRMEKVFIVSFVDERLSEFRQVIRAQMQPSS